MGGELSDSEPSRRSSAVSVWGPFLGEVVSKISADIVNMTEVELEKKFHPTPNDFFLRKRFWEITNTAQNTGQTDIEIIEMYRGICTRQNFYSHVLKNPYKVCWILLPLQRHMDLIEESLYFVLKKVRDEILTMPVNEKTAPTILKALAYFSDRALGPVVQRIEQKSMNVNVDGNRALSDAMNPQDLMEKYEQLKSKLVSLPEEAKLLNEPE